MVETLLTVGEQEVLELNTNLKRENLDLKLILAQLQQAERAQGWCPPARLSIPPLTKHVSPLSAAALVVPWQHVCVPSVILIRIGGRVSIECLHVMWGWLPQRGQSTTWPGCRRVQCALNVCSRPHEQQA